MEQNCMVSVSIDSSTHRYKAICIRSVHAAMVPLSRAIRASCGRFKNKWYVPKWKWQLAEVARRRIFATQQNKRPCNIFWNEAFQAEKEALCWQSPVFSGKGGDSRRGNQRVGKVWSKCNSTTTISFVCLFVFPFKHDVLPRAFFYAASA